MLHGGDRGQPFIQDGPVHGVLVGKFAVNYAVFDDKVASGKQRHE